MFLQQTFQGARIPAHGRVILASALAFHVTQQRAQVPHQRLELRPGVGKWPDDSFAAQHGLHTRDPPAPTEMSDRYRDQRHDDRKNREKDQQVLARVFAPASRETHVVHDLQDCRWLALLLDLRRRNMHRASRQVEKQSGAIDCLATRFAVDLARKVAGADHYPTLRVAEFEAEQPLVGGRPLEHCLDAAVGTGGQQAADLLIEGACHERGTDVEVARKPPSRQGIDERDRNVREADHCNQQWNEKAQREAKTAQHRRKRSDGACPLPEDAQKASSHGRLSRLAHMMIPTML